MNVFREHGEHGEHGERSGLRRGGLATGAVLTCATALLSVVMVGGSAHATVIDVVAVYGNSQAEAESWGAAWDNCRAQNSNTRSVRLEIHGDKTGPWGPGLPNQGVVYWECYDTTDATSLP